MFLSAEQVQALQEKIERLNRILQENSDDRNFIYVFGTNVALLLGHLRSVVRLPLRDLNQYSEDVRRIRHYLSRLVWTDNHARAEFFHQTQLLWTRYFPLNNFNDEGRVIDPISREVLEDPLVTASGYIMDKRSLNRYYQKTDSYMCKWHGAEQQVVPCDFRAAFDSDFLNTELNEQEVIHLLNNDVTVLKPDVQILNVGDDFAFDKIDLAEDLQSIEKKVSRLTIASHAKQWFDATSNVLGVLGFSALLVTSFCLSVVFLTPPLVPMVFGTLFGVSVFAGFVSGLADDGDFVSDFVMALISNWIAIALAVLLAPQVVLALASYSLISSAAAAAFIAAMPLILTLTPVANFVVATLGGMIFDDGNVFIRLNKALAYMTYNACCYIAGAVGGLIGGIVGIGVNCFRPAVLPTMELDVADFEEPRQSAPLSSAVHIANGLNIDPNVLANEVQEEAVAAPLVIVIDRPEENALQANSVVDAPLNSIRLAQ